MVTAEDFMREIGRFGGEAQSARLYSHLKDRILPANIKCKSHEEELAFKYSFPVWLVERWGKLFTKEELPVILDSLNQRPPLSIRVNPVKITREALLAHFHRKKIRRSPGAQVVSWYFV